MEDRAPYVRPLEIRASTDPSDYEIENSESHGSTLQCVGCERVIRIAGIHKIGTGVAQQSFDLLDRSPNYTARLAGLNLALQLEEAPIGAVEALRQDRCTVKDPDRACIFQTPLTPSLNPSLT